MGETVNSRRGGTKRAGFSRLSRRRNNRAGPRCGGGTPARNPRAGPAAAPFLFARLVPDDLDEPAAIARAIELDEQDALPGAEAELAVPHGNRLPGRSEKHRHAVRVAVAEFHVLGTDVLGAAVPVVGRVVLLAGNEPAQHADEVLEEPRSEPVDPPDAGRVRRVHARDAVGDAALLDTFLDFVGDVPDFQPASCPQPAFLLEDLHDELPPPAFEGRLRRNCNAVFLVTRGPSVQNDPSAP